MCTMEYTELSTSVCQVSPAPITLYTHMYMYMMRDVGAVKYYSKTNCEDGTCTQHRNHVC